MGFSSDSIRNLNKVEIFFLNSSNNGESTITGSSSDDRLFLYTNQGWDYNFAIDTSNVLFEGARSIIKSPLISTLATEISGGVATVIDMERKYAFSGSKPLEFTINGFRYLEKSVEQDIFHPINTLLSWLLPERDGESMGESLSGLIQNKITSVEQHNQTAKPSEKKSTAGWEFIQNSINAIEGFTGKTYFLRVPKQFNMDGGYKMAIKFGGQYIKNVFLKSVSIKTPKFHYESNGTPIPDKVDFSLTFETLRVAISTDYKFGL